MVIVLTGKSRDSLYTGRILEGFTLARRPAEDKKVGSVQEQQPLD